MNLLTPPQVAEKLQISLMRQSEVCQRLHICRNTLVKWRREGYVREVKLGRIVLIDLSPLYDSPLAEKVKMLDLRERAGL